MQLGGERGDIYRSCDRYSSSPETLFRHQTTEGVLFSSVQRRQRQMHSPRSGAFLRTATPSPSWRGSGYHRRSSLLRRSTRKGRVPSAEPLSFIPAAASCHMPHGQVCVADGGGSRFPFLRVRPRAVLSRETVGSFRFGEDREGKKSFVSSRE